jgi:hypothetical protein
MDALALLQAVSDAYRGLESLDGIERTLSIPVA